LAVAQLMWGVIQPLAGAVADRYGLAKILIAGTVVLAIGMALTPFMASGFGLIVSLGILAAIGSGADSSPGTTRRRRVNSFGHKDRFDL
jgi:MFS family permease